MLSTQDHTWVDCYNKDHETFENAPSAGTLHCTSHKCFVKMSRLLEESCSSGTIPLMCSFTQATKFFDRFSKPDFPVWHEKFLVACIVADRNIRLRLLLIRFSCNQSQTRLSHCRQTLLITAWNARWSRSRSQKKKATGVPKSPTLYSCKTILPLYWLHPCVNVVSGVIPPDVLGMTAATWESANSPPYMHSPGIQV